MDTKMEDALHLVSHMENYAIFGSVAAHGYVGSSYSSDLDVYFQDEESLKHAVTEAKIQGAKLVTYEDNYVKLEYNEIKLDFYLKPKDIHWNERQKKEIDNYKLELISPEDLIITKVRVTKAPNRDETKKERDKTSIRQLFKITSIGKVVQKTPNSQEAFSIMDYFYKQFGNQLQGLAR